MPREAAAATNPQIATADGEVRCKLPATASSAGSRNQNGQEMGAKGQNTRRRLLDAMAELLQLRPLHAISVADVARTAGTSSPTFYVYFQDVNDAALAVIDERTQSTPQLLQMIATDWRRGDVLAQAHAFVTAYADVWDSQAAIFRARNLAAEAGDARFYAARERAVGPLLEALAVKIHHSQESGRIATRTHPQAKAAVLLAMLERLSAVARRQTDQPGITFDLIMAAAADVLAAALEDTQPLEPVLVI